MRPTKPRQPAHNAPIGKSSVRVVLCAIAVALTACTTATGKAPASVMLDREQPPARRLAAAQRLHDTDPADESLLAASRTVLWSHGYTQEEREAALFRLLEVDPDATRQRLAAEPQYLPSVDILRTVYAIAAERQWGEFTSAAIRMYAQPLRGIPDTHRPERELLAAINDGATPEDVLKAVFVSSDQTYTHSDRVAAWLVLCRLLPRNDLVAMLRAAPADASALVSDLQAGWMRLRVLPTTREQVLWLMELQRNVQASFDAQVFGIETSDDMKMRHYSVALNVRRDAIAALGDQPAQHVRQALTQALMNAQTHRRNPGYPTSDLDPPQTLAEVDDRLTDADRMVLLEIVRAIHEPQVIAAFFEQADADHADTTTEYAGVLYRDGDYVAKLVPPLVTRHDAAHYASPELIFSLYTGLAHYHFHAQKHDNREFAGPGRGDMVFSENMGFNCLVLTFVSRDKLNVDFYADGNLIVDLGVIERPAAYD